MKQVNDAQFVPYSSSNNLMTS